MRIVQIINALTYGGAQFLLLDLAREARNAGNQIIIVCFRDGAIGHILRAEGFIVHVLGESIMDIPAFFKLNELLREFKPEVVHSHLFRATFWARIACRQLRNTRLITSIHGCETDFFHSIEKFMSQFSDFLVFPSLFLRDWYKNNFRKLSSRECAVIYPGVSIRPVIPLKSPAAVVNIGTLSRLHPVKGIDRLISACSELKKQGIAFKLYIGGNGKHKQALTELTQELGLTESVIFVGEINNRDAFLSELDIFVAPSRQEAFGIHICEAMERGLPIAGARVGGIPEIVEDHETGLLFDASDNESFTEALKFLINDCSFRKLAGERGREKVEKMFNRQVATAGHLEIYQNISSSNKKLHFAISSTELGGGERLALGIMQALKDKGWKITATCAGNPLEKAIKDSDIECSNASMRCGGLFFALRLLRDLVMIKPALISTHLNKASLIAGLLGRALSIPTVSHVHGLNKKSYYRFSDHLVAVSQAVNLHLSKQKIDSRKITTIANCIAKKALSGRLLAKKQLTIAITAKLHRNKGHKWAFKAIADNIEELGDIKIIIIGDGPERTELEKLCQKLRLQNIISFMGFLDNPEDLYHEVDIALLPSLGEGIPLSLLEAMRWGIPCIASNIGGIPEIITNNENGLLITPENSQELIDAINKMRSPEKYAEFSRKAIEHFKRINDYEKMISHLEKLFIETIESKS